MNNELQLDDKLYKFLQIFGYDKNRDKNYFFIPYVGDVNLNDYSTIFSIFEQIERKAYLEGLVKGRAEKQLEICIALGLRDNY